MTKITVRSKPPGFFRFLVLLSPFFVLIPLLILGVIGWILNIYKLSETDFKPSYKAEVIRVIGAITPIGAVTGYLDIEDEVDPPLTQPKDKNDSDNQER